jgi:hypothetical protein
MKEILMIKCEDRNECIRSMVLKMNAKFENYWGESNLLMSIAVVLDLKYKMKLINFCFPIIYPSNKYGGYIEDVLIVLKESFELYVSTHKASILQETAQVNAAAASSSAIVGDVVPKIFQGRSRFFDHIRSSNIIWPAKTDLDIYLEEDVYICEKNENGIAMEADFDALELWKSNALKYRILSQRIFWLFP